MQYFLTNCCTFLTKFWMHQVTFLWNFCHLFLVLYYEWTQVLVAVFNFLGFFLGIISWKSFYFSAGQCGRWRCFSVGWGFIFKRGEAWGINFDGGGGSKKIRMSPLSCPSPHHYAKPWSRYTIVKIKLKFVLYFMVDLLFLYSKLQMKLYRLLRGR